MGGGLGGTLFRLKKHYFCNFHQVFVILVKMTPTKGPLMKSSGTISCQTCHRDGKDQVIIHELQ